MEYQGEERRTFKRFPVKFRAKCKTILEDGKEKSFKGQITNISRAGVYMITKESIPVGATVELKIKLPDRKAPLKAKAVVRWIARAAIYPVLFEGMGMMFAELAEEDWSRISKVIK